MKVTLAIILFSIIFPISALFLLKPLYHFLGNVFIIYIISFCLSIYITYLIFKLWNKHKYKKLEEERIIQAEKEKEERIRREKEWEEERQKIAKEKEEERIRKAKEEEEEMIRQEEEKKRVSKEIENIIKNKKFLQTSLDSALGEEHCYININNMGWREPRKEGGKDVYKEIYRGNLYITSEKIILTTNSETKNIYLGEIVEMKEWKNAIEIRKIKGKNVLLAIMTKTNIYSVLTFIKEIKKIKELEYIYKEFYSNRRGLNYRIEIYAENEICKLQIYSEQEETANDENPPECTEKWEMDNKDIVDWLTKHNLFEGFDFVDYRWTKEFKFPYEYTNLYDLKDKLIKCLNEDVESIYSGE